MQINDIDMAVMENPSNGMTAFKVMSGEHEGLMFCFLVDEIEEGNVTIECLELPIGYAGTDEDIQAVLQMYGSLTLEHLVKMWESEPGFTSGSNEGESD